MAQHYKAVYKREKEKQEYYKAVEDFYKYHSHGGTAIYENLFKIQQLKYPHDPNKKYYYEYATD